MIYRALPASGLRVAWNIPNADLRDGGLPHTTAKFGWENEGWTVDCALGPERSQFVMRLSAQWLIQQVILFRDLETPDLWLATDGAGRWGEVNGAHRTDLDGCRFVMIGGTPITHCIAMRQLPLQIGHGAEVKTAVIDAETLGVVPAVLRFERLGESNWRYTPLPGAEMVEVVVDDFGLLLDEAGRFIRQDS
jgi:hypothetical protein